MNKCKSVLLTASLVLAITFTLSCSDDKEEGGGGGGYTGSYEEPITIGGQTYKTVKIGNQTWMAENLNSNAEGSKCYGDNPANCNTYGRLYDWETALTVCPSGWHLPTQEDYATLIATVGGNATAGTKLKTTSGWDNGNGTDDYGFSALPGGNFEGDQGFNTAGQRGYWWGASEYDEDIAYGFSIRGNENSAAGNEREKTRFFSVRCLKD
jgi:uncharacterized protein (TIGR02145 family)